VARLHPPCVIAFGPFEFDTATGRLTKDGILLRLQDQPRGILRLLLERSGEVVEREAIRAALWPDCVHVDFDRSVNAAVGRLRQVLCDTGARPLYIERVPKRGYRFIAPIRMNPVSVAPPLPPERLQAEAPVPASTDFLKRSRAGTLRVLIWSAAVLFLATLLASWMLRPPVPSVIRTTQITNDGRPKSSWLVSDGVRLYLTEFLNGGCDLFQTPVGSDSTPELLLFPDKWPQSLDMLPERDEVLVGANTGLFIWSTLLNRSRRVSDADCQFAKWSPDRSKIACATPSGLELMDSDGSHRRLLAPSLRIQGVAWRPDGTAIRYSGLSSFGDTLRMHEYDLTRGQDTIISGDKLRGAITGLFLRDGWHVYVSAADHNLYAVRGAGSPVALTSGPVQFYSVTANPTGDTLYAMGETRRGELTQFDAKRQLWEPFLGGRSADVVAWSPNGDYVAYVTYPEGELYRSRADGSDMLQLTSRPLQVYHPSWSPDGSQIAFSAASPNGVWRIFVVSPNGGSPEELTPKASPQLDQHDPVWSPDGRQIAFAPEPDLASPADLGIYIVDVHTREVRRASGTEGLFSPRWAPDGSALAALDGQMRLVLWECLTRRVHVLVNHAAGWPHWSRDGRCLYFITNQTIGRVSRRGVEETLMDIPFLVSGNTFSSTWDHNSYLGLGPGDALVVLRDRGTSELYALTLGWK
jgi:DNA-binding winged helix-turn-helix (wHTH) protein/dipeptidyl aminopeptidase/acylaminoacyl peptidase